MYNIKIEQFEGPLDLLLQLTEQEKLDITRVSLAQIADQYLQYISQAENITLQNLADFLSVASKLILIKSKALLPLLEFSPEEEEEIKDLEHQLAEYKKFKEAAGGLNLLLQNPLRFFSRESFVGQGVVCYTSVASYGENHLGGESERRGREDDDSGESRRVSCPAGQVRSSC